jgi:peptide deformylase
VIRAVLRYPDPALKQVCRPADREEAERVAKDLLDTMRSFPGCVGIAAPQIGEPVRVAVVDVSEHPRADTSNGLLVLVNPRVEHAEGAEVAREGCLSIPDLTANVRRATAIRVRSGDLVAECLGFEARCVLHELDHLDGLLFLDRVDSIASDVFFRKVYKQ